MHHSLPAFCIVKIGTAQKRQQFFYFAIFPSLLSIRPFCCFLVLSLSLSLVFYSHRSFYLLAERCRFYASIACKCIRFRQKAVILWLCSSTVHVVELYGIGQPVPRAQLYSVALTLVTWGKDIITDATVTADETAGAVNSQLKSCKICKFLHNNNIAASM